MFGAGGGGFGATGGTGFGTCESSFPRNLIVTSRTSPTAAPATSAVDTADDGRVLDAGCPKGCGSIVVSDDRMVPPFDGCLPS